MNIKQSFRIIFRNKTYSILNIAGLAVGIASAALILLWVEDELTYDRVYPNSENLYVLGSTDKPGDKTLTSFVSSNPLAEALSTDFPGIRKITRCEKSKSLFSADGATGFKEDGCFVDSAFFSMFGVEMRGNAATVFAGSGSTVVSEQLAAKLFGKDDPIGKAIMIDGVHHGYITGIFRNFPNNSSFGYQWLRPFDEMLQQRRVDGMRGNVDNWFSHWITAYVELEPSADAATVNTNLMALIKEKTERTNAGAFVYPLADMRLYGEFVDGKPTGGGYIRTIRLFAVIACIILLIACINYMNLTTARSGKRVLEVGVCKTFGAKRARLMTQFMCESGMITFISLLAAILIICISLPAFNQLVDKQLSIQLLRPSHLFGLLGIGLICTFLAGSYPSFYLSAFNPITTLTKMKNRTGGGIAWIRKGLVVFQFAIAFILICGATVIYLQIQHIRNRPLGYDKEQVVMVEANDKIVAGFSAIQNELTNQGYVANVALSHGSILDINSSGSGFGWAGKPDDLNPTLTRMYVCPGFVETVGLHIVEGRDFSAENEADKSRVIINRQLADLMGGEGRVGGVIGRGKTAYEIAGIVDNFVFNDIYKAASEPVIVFNMPKAANTLYVRVKEGADMQAAIGGIQAVVAQFSGIDPFTYTFMDEAFGRAFSAQQREGSLAGIFSGLAIFISCLGLFGLSAFMAEQRTKEIGIRKVLGASVFSLSRLLVNNFFVLICISLAIGLPVAWYFTREWLIEYEYRIDGNWLIFAFAGLLVITVAIFTVGFQAIKAATANPVKAIKSE